MNAITVRGLTHTHTQTHTKTHYLSPDNIPHKGVIKTRPARHQKQKTERRKDKESEGNRRTIRVHTEMSCCSFSYRATMIIRKRKRLIQASVYEQIADTVGKQKGKKDTNHQFRVILGLHSPFWRKTPG